MVGPGEAVSQLATVRLGASGPLVGVQGLGCMGMSEFYGPSDPAESTATLHRALELGVTLFDTADSYGIGANERLLSGFVRANRERVVIATKFGLVRRAADPRYRRIDNSRSYLRTAVVASLRRLRVDAIDLYYAHRLHPRTRLEETVAAMAELVAEGKVRYLGLCEVTGEQLRRAHAVHPIAAVQSEWSLFSREVEQDLVATAAQLSVAMVPYSPLGRGLLTGGFTSTDQLASDDFRRHMPRFVGANGRHNANLVTPLRAIAAERGVRPAQVALAWVQQRAAVHGLPVVPIPGTRNPHRLRENVAAASLVLTSAELAELEPVAAAVAGSRQAGLSFDAR